ncbi:hypothetical protein COLO4_19560 [Corchorus olitorius]|uniref:Uncharacterized protein n=1 Tax=Corchorus olitorius TaxID=93759 RepID=A0A1R3J4V3_9ROSI|nr:hypothetical protein COLO4_19560 [Corchorus olitorius]
MEEKNWVEREALLLKDRDQHQAASELSLWLSFLCTRVK